jgi:hypothetical protein
MSLLGRINLSREAEKIEEVSQSSGSTITTRGTQEVSLVSIAEFIAKDNYGERETMEFLFKNAEGKTLTHRMDVRTKDGNESKKVTGLLTKLGLTNSEGVEAFNNLLKSAIQVPKYTDKFKKDYKATVVNLPAGTNFIILGKVELSMGKDKDKKADEIKDFIVMDDFQIFRVSDKADAGAIKTLLKNPNREVDVAYNYNFWSSEDALPKTVDFKYRADGKFKNNPILKEAFKILQKQTRLTAGDKKRLMENTNNKQESDTESSLEEITF